MRYRYEEYSSQNKRQYVIVVGVHELRAMIDAISAVKSNSPRRTTEQKDFISSLGSSLKGLHQALKEAEKLQDDGKRRNPYVGNEKTGVRDVIQ